MTQDEFDVFFDNACCKFGGLIDWMEKSPNPGVTLDGWFKCLRDVSLNEANEVIEGWADGTIKEPPIGYRRELFALDVKAIAGQKRFENAKEQRREEEWLKANRAKYQRPAGLVLLSPYLNRIFEKQADFRNGNLTQAELDEQTNAIVEEFANAK
jgi:hypothetical protein